MGWKPEGLRKTRRLGRIAKKKGFLEYDVFRMALFHMREKMLPYTVTQSWISDGYCLQRSSCLQSTPKFDGRF